MVKKHPWGSIRKRAYDMFEEKSKQYDRNYILYYVKRKLEIEDMRVIVSLYNQWECYIKRNYLHSKENIYFT